MGRDGQTVFAPATMQLVVHVDGIWQGKPWSFSQAIELPSDLIIRLIEVREPIRGLVLTRGMMAPAPLRHPDDIEEVL